MLIKLEFSWSVFGGGSASHTNTCSTWHLDDSKVLKYFKSTFSFLLNLQKILFEKKLIFRNCRIVVPPPPPSWKSVFFLWEGGGGNYSTNSGSFVFFCWKDLLLFLTKKQILCLVKSFLNIKLFFAKKFVFEKQQ